jgi:cystathionine beta-lyase
MEKNDDKGAPPLRPATRLTRSGRDKSLTGQFVNPPVIHASTVLFETVDDMLHRRQRYLYGRRGTPTTEALELAVGDLEGADGVVLCPSGLSAAATALLSCLSTGDEVLIVDGVYGPVRHLADTTLKRLGITTTYFDPAVGAGIAALFTERTRAVYMEAPASLTFEMQDVPAIAAVAKARGATVLFDNTWATPFHFRALDHGVDLSVIAGTKYFVGHSDAMLGTVAARGDAWPRLKEVHGSTGLHVGPDDVYLGLRGIRTLAIRLERHAQSAMIIATWLASRPEVARVVYPPLASDPGHALWKRDMTGASGLFGVVLNGWNEEQAKQFIDGLQLFGIGASWGGFESLATLSRPIRTATRWQAEGVLIRLHIGLEDPADLMADLEAGFTRVAAVA